ncbi:helix-turn-helix domain-containing protein [Zavarzinia sp. CC-PAN008]|uniref:helix-turn-helix domain-containing protein n=1 Tax=Zavarzinia sp. CC-PAN008 TaxID=3243332 RepID=UPI003F746DF6
MRFAEWRREQGLTLEEVAEKIGRHHSSVSRYERGTRMPDPEAMAAIVRETGGAVQPNDFYTLPAAPAERTEEAA